MAQLSVEIERDNDNPSNALGKWDSFMGVAQPETEIKINAPDGWQVNGVNLYLNQAGEPPNRQKKEFVQSIKKNWTKEQWAEAFSTLATGWSFGKDGSGNDDYSVLIDNGESGASYEYVIWIQQTDNPDENDYCDPGVKNTY